MNKVNHACVFPHWQSPQLSPHRGIDWRHFEKVAVLFDAQDEAQCTACCEALITAGASVAQLWPVTRASGSNSNLAELQTQCVVLSEAQRQGWRNVVLLDARYPLEQGERVSAQVNNVFASLRRLEWHMLLLGGRYQQCSPLLALPGVARIHHASSIAAYAVNASYYSVLLHAYHRAIERGSSLDDIWSLLMGKHSWLGVNPGLVSLPDNEQPPSSIGHPEDKQK